MEARLEIAPCPTAATRALRRELGVSPALAQVLARRGLGDVAAARAWLAADEAHDPLAWDGMAEAVTVVLGHVRAGTRITVHGDYDVDGVSATAILVGVLRDLGAEVDWYLPSRTEDGYGLGAATVERLAARGTRLLVTADCGITSVDEVAAARAAGLDVVVTDHHALRADGRRPDAPIVHPALGGYPCPDLCAAGVAHKVAAALLGAAGRGRAGADRADDDLDLVALATVADCVPLRGENRRLVRAGLAALARTRRPGLRALLRVAQADPGELDARTVGFRLAPRLNAAGRLARADAALELLLTTDEARAGEIADELDRLNAERRLVEQRILWAAEAQVAELQQAQAAAGGGPPPAYVLWGDDWHPGVIGIVASRIAERHHRPALLIALDGDRGTGSGRSIPAFDLLGGLDACAGHLLRHGGHRAAAGCTVARAELDALRAAFAAHAASVLSADDLVPVQRVDAVVAGDELGLELAEELGRLAPFGTANPDVALLVPAARLADPRPMGEGKHLRFTLEAGPARARGVAFSRTSLPEAPDGVLDAVVALERNAWQGTVEPRLVLRCATAPDPGPITVLDPGGDAGADPVAGPARRRRPRGGGGPARARAPAGRGDPGRGPPRRRHRGPAGRARRVRRAGPRRLRRRRAARAAPGPAGGRLRAVLVRRARRRPGARARPTGTSSRSTRPPARPTPSCSPPTSVPPSTSRGARPEVAFALRVSERDHDLRAPLLGLYRALRDAPGRPLPTVLAEHGPAARATACWRS